MKNTSNRHEHYETLNLIGYALSKFGKPFVHEFGFTAKTHFYEYIVKLGIAKTNDVVKNRQDLFNGMDYEKKKGWWQKGPMYKHRKDYIDSLFETLNMSEFAEIVKMSIAEAIQDIVR
jgi:hypothetical protein